jgi:hypothetical protein
MLRKAIDLVEQDHIPDVLTRMVINGIVAKRCRRERKRYRNKSAMTDFLTQVQQSPVAHPPTANCFAIFSVTSRSPTFLSRSQKPIG